MEDKGKWIFPSPDNEAVAEVTNIKIPEWSFEPERKKITKPGYYDEFGNEVGLISSSDSTLYLYKDSSDWNGPKILMVFNNGGVEKDGSSATIVAIGLGGNLSFQFNFWGHNNNIYFSSIEIPAYYAVKVNSNLVIHPITQIGYDSNQPNGTAYSVFGDNATGQNFYLFGCSKNFCIIIPPTITTIGKKAFYDLGFNSYHFTSSNNIKKIEDSAFDSNKSPLKKTIDTTHKFSRKDKKGDSIIKKGIQEIGEYSFRYCAFDETVNLFFLDKITESSFYESTIPELNFSNGLISEIGTSSFQNSKIQKINMSNATIQTINYYAFYYCDIDEVNMSGSNIKQIFMYAFSCLYCIDKIKTVFDFTNATIEYIGASCFEYGNYPYWKNGKKYDELGLSKNVFIISNTKFKTIGDYAFNSTNFENKSVMDFRNSGLNYIGSYCFSNCGFNGLTTFEIPDTVSYIGERVFTGATTKNEHVQVNLYNPQLSKFAKGWNKENGNISFNYKY